MKIIVGLFFITNKTQGMGIEVLLELLYSHYKAIIKPL